jgi:hypothetical protein
MYRTRERRPELKASCRVRRQGPATCHAAERRANERLPGNCAHDRRPTRGRGAAPRKAISRRLLPGHLGRPQDHGRHPFKGKWKSCRSRTMPPSTASDTGSRSRFGRLKDWRRIGDIARVGEVLALAVLHQAQTVVDRAKCRRDLIIGGKFLCLQGCRKQRSSKCVTAHAFGDTNSCHARFPGSKTSLTR